MKRLFMSGEVNQVELHRSADNLTGYVVLGCVLFNFLLCFVNTTLTPINSLSVIASELLLTGSAFVLAVRKLNNEKGYWLTVIFLQVMLLIWLSIVKDEILAKPLRDVIIMPVFILLGLSAAKVRLNSIILWLSAFIMVIGFYEALAVESFLSWFNVRNYFIAKGAANDFSFVESDLFVSGVRPNGTFLLDAGFHRISSVFLEPVSLGFYGFITGTFAIAIREKLSNAIFFPLLSLAFILIWLSDGRMAFGALILVILARPLLAVLDHRLNILIFPAMLGISTVIYSLRLLPFDGEGTGARIFSTMDKLVTTDTSILFGFSHYTDYTADSALLDLLANHGIIGFLIFWLSPLLFKTRLSREARIYLFGVSIFLSFGFMFSAAIFTIKTAALLWFIHGYLIAKYPAPEKEPIHES